MPQDPKPARRSILLGAIALTLLVGWVFRPILDFEFTDCDVPEQVINNPHVRGLSVENLKHIFTSRRTGSYYPIRSLTYAIDYHLWGLDPRGFKSTNALVHVANVLLVFWLVRRLFGLHTAVQASPRVWWNASVATLCAGIFAVHPVVVEPVTWVAGREELLMTLGALGCLHFHLTARRLEGNSPPSRRVLCCRAGAAFCCLAACLSNAVGAVIPLLITAWDLLTPPRPGWRKIVRGTSALWVIGLVTIAIKKSGYSPATTDLPRFLSGQWAGTVLNVYWLNLKTLFCPTELAIHYDWPGSEGDLGRGVLLGGLAVGVTLVLLGLTGLAAWKLRRGTLVLVGLVWFVVAAAPTSQIMPHHIVRADRFLYLPLVGLAVAMAIGLRPLGNASKQTAMRVATIAAGLFGLFLLGTLSARQVETWRDPLSVWENCLRVDPHNAFAHNGLANNLTDRGESRRALAHYRTALRISPNSVSVLSDFARALARFDDRQLRDYERAVRLAERACELSSGKDPRMLRRLAMVHCDYASDLAARGEYLRARRHYEQAIAVAPQYELPLFSLALLLATCEDEALRQPDLAVELAERGHELLEIPDPHRLLILAAVYAQAGWFEEAAAAAEKAIPLAQAAGDWEMADDLRHRFEYYGNQIPRDSSGD